MLERPSAILKLLQLVRHQVRKHRTPCSRPAVSGRMPHGDDRVRVRIRQRSEHQTADEAEGRRVRADAEAENPYHSHGERRARPELPYRVTQILQESFHSHLPVPPETASPVSLPSHALPGHGTPAGRVCVRSRQRKPRTLQCRWCRYSARIATIGSILPARRAADTPDKIATPESTTTARTNATGSIGLTPYSIVSMNRTEPPAITIPIAAPSATRRRPLCVTSPTTRAGLAPNAIRTPMLDVSRAETVYADHSHESHRPRPPDHGKPRGRKFPTAPTARINMLYSRYHGDKTCATRSSIAPASVVKRCSGIERSLNLLGGCDRETKRIGRFPCPDPQAVALSTWDASPRECRGAFTTGS